MFDLWAPEHSVLREKVLEHAFLTELSKVLLLDLKTPFEVLRSEFDGFGYDVVIEAKGVLRHVQLKATRAGGERAHVDVGLSLTRKPGGCVVWFMVDERTLAIGPFYWLGGEPGEKMPALGDKVARHTRGSGERTGLRQVTKGRFDRIATMRDLAVAMFGEPCDLHNRLLLAHLAERGQSIDDARLADELAWEASFDLAHMIDGYALADRAGLGGAVAFSDRAYADAERLGEWQGSALELWVSLFMEHRRDHLGGPVAHVIDGELLTIEPTARPMRDALCLALSASLGRLARSG